MKWPSTAVHASHYQGGTEGGLGICWQGPKTISILHSRTFFIHCLHSSLLSVKDSRIYFRFILSLIEEAVNFLFFCGTGDGTSHCDAWSVIEQQKAM